MAPPLLSPRCDAKQLVSLLVLLVELLVELCDFFREYIDENVASLFPLLVFFHDSLGDLDYLLAIGVLIAVLAILPSLLFLG